MFNFDVYIDMAGNTRANLPSHVAHYAVMFTESGVVAVVSEHQTTEPLRSDISFRNQGTGELVNRTF
ncbi:hypothetical protein [Pseudomonas serbica]|uniref:hypothetical protein n=1 Tax=Pseudomonas serbica TaxID=2965074 RepID=UPI00237C42A8|nr:hypothetical protein [Pseudomonas serbica]